jgi:hypothetical protein
LQVLFYSLGLCKPGRFLPRGSPKACFYSLAAGHEFRPEPNDPDDQNRSKQNVPAFFLLLYFSTGDSVQQLFGGVDPSSKMLADRYKEAPELAAYLTARASRAKITLLHTPLLGFTIFF